MRFFIILIIILNTSYALGCPRLAGEYHCMISPTQYSLLKISQQPFSVEVEQYSFDYTAIPGEPDVITASSTGEPDSWGYINRCTSKRLLSMASDGSSMAELYLNSEGNYVYALNGSIVYTCPPRL